MDKFDAIILFHTCFVSLLRHVKSAFLLLTRSTLQLVQNCDDNKYEPGVIPALRIEIHPDRLAFRNNELGFTKEQVFALCNIGASTKPRAAAAAAAAAAAVMAVAPAGSEAEVEAAGYIGNKGIGFKSVFKVAQRPCIHSRTFHFQFDSDGAGADGFAYIIPTPLPTPPGWDLTQGTDIILPFKSDPSKTRKPQADSVESGNAQEDDIGCREVFEMVRANVYDIESSLLLFLNRLRRIEIVDASQAPPHCRVMCRREEADGVVRIEDSSSTSAASAERWLITSRILRAEVRRGERPEGELTRLSVAIPLLSAAALQPGAPPPPARDVFAFLPLRSYGFRWVLQVSLFTPQMIVL
jgi:hypothetical protein